MKPTTVPIRVALATALLLLTVAPTQAAFTGYCALTANGTALDGDTSVSTIGGDDVEADHIEIFELHHLIARRDTQGGTGAVDHENLIFTKAIDRTSPLLAQALDQNQLIEGVCKFYRPNSQSGQTERFYSIGITGGRVVAIEPMLPDVHDAALANRPLQERVRLIYQTIAFTSDAGSTQYTMSVAP